MATKSGDEILDLMREAQELGRALEDASQKMGQMAENATSSLQNLSGATEEERRKISSINAELDQSKRRWKDLAEDYSSAFIISQNYYKALEKVGKASSLSGMSKVLEDQHKRLSSILKIVEELTMKVPQVSSIGFGNSEKGSAAPPSLKDIESMVGALQGLQSQMNASASVALELGNKIKQGLGEGQTATAEGRKGLADLVAGFQKARSEFEQFSSRFVKTQDAVLSDMDRFEKAGGKITQPLVDALDGAIDKTRLLQKEMKEVSGAVSGAIRVSPDLAGTSGGESLAKKNAQAQAELTSVFSEQNRVLQENRALLAQDQEYMRLQAEVTTSAEGSVRQMTAQMKLLKMELENMAPATQADMAAMDQLRTQINKLAVSIKNASAEEKQHVISISEYGEASAFVASDIRRAIQALTQIRSKMKEVDTSTEEGRTELAKMVDQYKKLNKEIGQLKRQYNTVKTTTQALGSQAGVIANVGAAVTSMTYGVQVYTGLMNLAGGASKEWGQALLKLQSIMAITNGLTMIYNNLLKTGRLYQIAENAAVGLMSRILGVKTAAQNADNVATAEGTAATMASTAAQEAENIAVGAGAAAMEAKATATAAATGAEIAHAGAIGKSTAAARVLSGTLKAGPLIILTAILAAIALIIKGITKWANAWRKPIEQTKARMERFNEVLSAQRKRATELVKVQEQMVKSYRGLADSAHAYYTERHRLEDLEWEKQAKQALGELDVAAKDHLVTVEGLSETIQELSTGFFELANYDPSSSGLEYFGALSDVMTNLDDQTKQLDRNIGDMQQTLELLHQFGDGDLEKKVGKISAGLQFQVSGSSVDKMTFQEAIDFMSARLKEASDKKQFMIDLTLNLDQIANQRKKINQDQMYEEMAIQNTVLQAKHDANIAAMENIEQRFKRERALARENTQAEIDQINYRLQTEQDLGAEGAAALNQKKAALEKALQIELREIREEEDAANLEAYRNMEDAKWDAEVDSHKKRMALLKIESARALEDIDIRLATDQELTEKEVEALQKQREYLMAKAQKDEIELNRELMQELISAERTRYEIGAEAARESSEEALSYTKMALEKQMEAELLAREQMTEEERAMYATELEIRIKYARAIAEAEYKYETESAEKILESKQRLDKALFESKERSIYEIAKFEMEQQVELLQAERDRYAEEVRMELSLIEMMLTQQQITEETAKAMIAELDPMLVTIDAIDQEIRNLIANWDKDLEASNIWELLGMSKRESSAFKVFIDSLKESLQEALDAWKEYYDKKVELAEEALTEAKNEYEVQQQLRAEGYANSVETARREMEEKRKLRNQALREQAAAEKAQEALNTAEEVSELTLAVAKVFSAFGWPLGAAMSAAMVAAFIGAKITAANAARAKANLYRDGTVELLEGGSHASGHDISLGIGKDGKERRAEGGEFFAIINKRSSRKYRSLIPDVIKSFNNGTFSQKYTDALDQTGNLISLATADQGTDLTQLEQDVRAIKDQGKTRVYVDQQGNVIEVRKGFTRKTIRR